MTVTIIDIQTGATVHGPIEGSCFPPLLEKSVFEIDGVWYLKLNEKQWTEDHEFEPVGFREITAVQTSVLVRYVFVGRDERGNRMMKKVSRIAREEKK